MKSILYLCATVALFASCNSEEIQSQRCKGILLDSLTSLSKFRDRVVCLETGACGMLNEYQAKIDSLQNEIDSLNKMGSRYQRLYRSKSSARMLRHSYNKAVVKTKHSKTYPMEVKAAPASVPKTNSKDPFYYDQSLQKYFFYDREHKVYYSFDPISRKKIYQ